MSWRKLATGSGSACGVIVDNDVSGAMENMIAGNDQGSQNDSETDHSR